MCNACGNYCCGSDVFDRCGCDGCREPDCWSDEADDIDFGDDMGGPDPDDGGVLMPLAACGCAAVARFMCEAVGEPISGRASVLRHLEIEPKVQAKRALLAQSDTGAPDLAITHEGQVLWDAAGGDHAHVGGRFAGRQHRARHVEAAEADRGRRVRGRVSEVLVGHAERVLQVEAPRVGTAWLPVCCSAATTEAVAVARS